MKRLLALGLLLFGAASEAAVIKTVAAGATDQTVVIKIIDATTGAPKTDAVFNSAGIDLEYWRHGANAVTDITEVTQTVSGAHTDGGFVSLGNGYYRLDLPDAAVASGTTAVEVMGAITGGIVIGGTVQLSPPVTASALSSGAINRAAFNADANPLFGIVGSGTAQAATSTSLTLASGATVKPGWTLNITGGSTGVGETAVISSVSGSGTGTPVATISGWAGGVTPTGTISYIAYGTSTASGGSGASAADIWGYAGGRTLSAATNITSTGGTIAIDGSGRPGVNWGNVGSPTTTVNLSGTTISTTQAVASVSGNVAGTVNGLTSTAQGNVRTALGMASANMDTQLGTINTAVGTTIPAAVAVIDGIVDQLLVGVNVSRMNGITVIGQGTEAQPWNGSP